MSVQHVGLGGNPMPQDYLARWEQWMRAAGRSPTTIHTRLSGMQTLCRHAGVTSVTAVTGDHVAAWLADCSKPWTRSTYWMTVKCWVAWALAEGVICADPTARLAKPRRPKCVPRPVSDAVIRQLLAGPPIRNSVSKQESYNGKRVRLYVALAALAGLRVHEIAKVRGEDIDPAGWLFVDGKGGQRCAIPLHPELAALARGLPEVDYWFPGRDSGHVSGAWVSACITRALRAVGSNATAHQLRHSFGTAVLRSSRDLRVTQELLRHASPASTAVYTAVADTDKVDAIRRLGWVA
ncbi:MAG: tyrosine-type recombinase/integrase [Actinomycetota bacterium]|nr:tyrosine-type recombinase/integrase [Actinomycetota bacterium]